MKHLKAYIKASLKHCVIPCIKFIGRRCLNRQLGVYLTIIIIQLLRKSEKNRLMITIIMEKPSRSCTKIHKPQRKVIQWLQLTIFQVSTLANIFIVNMRTASLFLVLCKSNCYKADYVNFVSFEQVRLDHQRHYLIDRRSDSRAFMYDY